jgi:hypothetical protein
MRTTIRHLSAADSLRAYLRGAGVVLTGARVIDYMQLMHNVTPATTSRALQRLVRRGEAVRPRRGLYQWSGQ